MKTQKKGKENKNMQRLERGVWKRFCGQRALKGPSQHKIKQIPAEVDHLEQNVTFNQVLFGFYVQRGFDGVGFKSHYDRWSLILQIRSF